MVFASQDKNFSGQHIFQDLKKGCIENFRTYLTVYSLTHSLHTWTLSHLPTRTHCYLNYPIIQSNSSNQLPPCLPSLSPSPFLPFLSSLSLFVPSFLLSLYLYLSPYLHSFSFEHLSLPFPTLSSPSLSLLSLLPLSLSLYPSHFLLSLLHYPSHFLLSHQLVHGPCCWASFE